MSQTSIGLKSSSLTQMAWNLLYSKTPVPIEFHAQVAAIEKMLITDSTGLVDSITDLMVDSALVDLEIETLKDEDNFYDILNGDWLENINSEYRGRGVRVGIKGLMKEYFQERWKGASFPILKITNWKKVKGINLPVSMFFVDGSSIYSHENPDEELSVDTYEYYLGKRKDKKHLLAGPSIIITKPFSRNFVEYPVPFLIKRGVYQNWKILHSIKSKQQILVDQVIPYMMLIKKSTEKLIAENIKTYSDEELKAIVTQFQDLQIKLGLARNTLGMAQETPVRATNADEDISHMVPKIDEMFKREIFVTGEKNILSGLGFIDVIDQLSSKKEASLNPKAFMNELNSGIDDFKAILSDLVAKIKEANTGAHKKFTNIDTCILSNPLKSFMTDDFKKVLTQVYDRGCMSKQTYVELVSEVDFDSEVYRRRSEARMGIDEDMYPQVTQNQPGGLSQYPSKESQDNIPMEKQGPEAKNFVKAGVEESTEAQIIVDEAILLAEQEPELEEASGGHVASNEPDNPVKIYTKVVENSPTIIENKSDLESAPYKGIETLPDWVKEYPKKAKIAWMKSWNNSYNFYKNETTAFKIAAKALSTFMKKHNLKNPKRGSK